MIRLIDIVFSVYSWLIIIRVFLSWFPINDRNEFVQQLYKITDPYLDLFRKIIPTIGMIDISPIVAIIVLSILERLVMYILYLSGLFIFY